MFGLLYFDHLNLFRISDFVLGISPYPTWRALRLCASHSDLGRGSAGSGLIFLQGLSMLHESSRLDLCNTLLFQPREKSRRVVRNRRSNRRRSGAESHPSNHRRTGDETHPWKSRPNRRILVTLRRAIGLRLAIRRAEKGQKDSRLAGC